MKNGLWKQAKLLRMWKEDPTCLYCGNPTVLIFRPPSVGMKQFPARPNEATFKHIHSRLNSERGKHPNCQTVYLACMKCNNERNHQEMMDQPVDRLRDRAGAYGRKRMCEDRV